MIAVDTNILVAFQRSEYPHHARAAEMIRAVAEGSSAWAIPWPCVHEFLAIITHPRIFRRPTEMTIALDVITALLESPTVRVLSESCSYWDVLQKLLLASQVQGPRVHDARIAALCLDHGVRELWTADRDFSRFAGLKCRNPLV